MRIAIVGGTGTLGSHICSDLAARGHEIRVLSRRSTDFPVELISGAGLAAALEHCDVVVDASNASSQRRAEGVLVGGSSRLLAAGHAAGVRHHVGVSIVGCDLAPVGYYRVKTEQEHVISGGPVPWSLVRATQFHELAARALATAARYRVLPLPGMLVQPVAAAEVGRAVAAVAEGEPLRHRLQVAGPEIMTAAALASTWQAATGRRAVRFAVPVPGKLGRALRAGALTTSKPDIMGKITFAEWLSDGPARPR